MPAVAMSLLFLGLSFLFAGITAWYMERAAQQGPQQQLSFGGVHWADWQHSLVLIHHPDVPSDAPGALAYVSGVQRHVIAKKPQLMLFLTPIDIAALSGPNSLAWIKPVHAFATTSEMYAVPWDNVTMVIHSHIMEPDKHPTTLWWLDMGRNLKTSTLQWQRHSNPPRSPHQVLQPLRVCQMTRSV